MGKVSLQVGAPLPSTLGRCADAYKEVSELRLAMQKEVDAVKARENEIKEHLINNLAAVGDEKDDRDTGASGLKYRAQVKRDEVPVVDDWEALWDYVFEQDRVDLMQKSIARKAVMEMIDQGEEVPGVSTMYVKKLSVTKL